MDARSMASKVTPFRQLATMSRGPPVPVTASGRPEAAASMRVRPKVSAKAGLTQMPRRWAASR